MQTTTRPSTPSDGFSARNLISIDDLSRDDIYYILDLAEYYAGFLRLGARPPQRLAGLTQVNLFFEDSTRTNLSFELAGSKLGADILNVPIAASSVNKGEGLIDTVQTLAAMGAHAMIVRHREPRVHEDLAQRLACPVINAGDGVREHPTQALLDCATIRSVFDAIDGLTIAICGDIKHSRVAGSGARLLQRLGAEVRFVGPQNLLPATDAFPGVKHADTLKEGLADADIVMGLRMQFERMDNADDARDAAADYHRTYGLTYETLKHAKPEAYIMHPGPMNRGVEIDGALADDADRSLILTQVFYGVATRMACLDALLTRSSE